MIDIGAPMGVDRADPEVPELSAGRRVSCDGERATVRYVGPVPPTAGALEPRCFAVINKYIMAFN